VIVGSGLDWTVLRPPFLTDEPASGRVRYDLESGDPSLRWKIPRADMAGALVEHVRTGARVHERVGISAQVPKLA
jgi:uncharacterized protein YbjT (DUF2867 family)